MAENFNHFLTRHHLLDITVHTSHILLAPFKIASRELGHRDRNYHCTGGAQQRQAGQWYIQHYHAHEGRNKRYGGAEKVRKRAADHLPERVHIICEHRHNGTVRVGVKIAQRKAQEMIERVGTELPDYSLFHFDHQEVKEERSKRAH